MLTLFLLVLQLQGLFPAQPTNFLTDLAGKVADPTKVNDYLRSLQQKDTLQLVAVILPTTNGRPVEDVARAIGRQWKIAQKDSIGSELRNTGGVILLVIDSRQCRVEVARGSEGYMQDARAADACRSARDQFRAGDFGGGIIKIAEQFATRHRAMLATRTAVQPSVVRKQSGGWGWGETILVLVGLGVVLFVALLVRRIDKQEDKARKEREENYQRYLDLIKQEAKRDREERQAPPIPQPIRKRRAEHAPAPARRTPTPVSPPIVYITPSPSPSYDSGSSSSSSSDSIGGGSDSFGGGGGGDSW